MHDALGERRSRGRRGSGRRTARWTSRRSSARSGTQIAGVQETTEEALRALANLEKDEQTLRGQDRRAARRRNSSARGKAAEHARVRPAGVMDHDRLREGLGDLYAAYLERHRNLHYLEAQLEARREGRARRRLTPLSLGALEKMRKRLRAEELKVLRGETSVDDAEDEFDEDSFDQEERRRAAGGSAGGGEAGGRRGASQASTRRLGWLRRGSGSAWAGASSAGRRRAGGRGRWSCSLCSGRAGRGRHELGRVERRWDQGRRRTRGRSARRSVLSQRRLRRARRAADDDSCSTKSECARRRRTRVERRGSVVGERARRSSRSSGLPRQDFPRASSAHGRDDRVRRPGTVEKWGSASATWQRGRSTAWGAMFRRAAACVVAGVRVCLGVAYCGHRRPPPSPKRQTSRAARRVAAHVRGGRRALPGERRAHDPRDPHATPPRRPGWDAATSAAPVAPARGVHVLVADVVSRDRLEADGRSRREALQGGGASAGRRAASGLASSPPRDPRRVVCSLAREALWPAQGRRGARHLRGGGERAAAARGARCPSPTHRPRGLDGPPGRLRAILLAGPSSSGVEDEQTAEARAAAPDARLDFDVAARAAGAGGF